MCMYIHVQCCFALFVCLTLLASFFLLISHLKTCTICVFTCTIRVCIHVLMKDEKEGRKKEARSNKQQFFKAKQHSTPKAVTLPKKNELPRMGQYVYVHVYTRVQVYVHVYTRVQVYVHVYTRVQVYVHVYTRVQVGWTAVVSAVVWQRMLKILGDVNAISDPAIHHLAFLKLLGIWRLLEEVRRGGRGEKGGGRGVDQCT